MEVSKLLDKNKKAFTLAEVLITVLIIGIVAALTIPTLVSAYRKQQAESALRKFNETMTNAIDISESDNGSSLEWRPMGFTEEEAWAEEYLMPYLKDATLEYVKKDGTDGIKITFADGGVLHMTESATHFYVSTPDFENTNEEDARGISAFTFYFSPSCKFDGYCDYHKGHGFEPFAFAWDGDDKTLIEHETFGCNETAYTKGAYCTELIQRNGWKIPEDYPLKF